MQILPCPCALPLASTPVLLPGLASPHIHTLPNGARSVLLPLADSPLVCLDFWCRAGSVFEEPRESGLAHFLEHMVFKGSARLGPGEFDGRIEALGGSSNAATGFDDVHYHVLIPPESALEALDLLLDLVLEPALVDEAFQMERQVVLEELAQSEDQPDDVALQRLLRLGCGSHAYGAPILGERQALLAHTPGAMASFQKRLYGANRCVLAVAGALESLEPALESRIEASPLASLPLLDEPSGRSPMGVAPGQHRLALPRLEAARLLMLWALPPAGDLAAVMGADLLTTLLAEGRRSRLVALLREELQLVESIDLDLHVMECGSFALLEAICEPEDLGAVRQAIDGAWLQLQQEAIGEPEWQRALHLVANGYRFSLESPAGVAGTIGNNLLWGRPQALGRPLEHLHRWTPDALQRQLVPLLDPSLACVLEAVPA